VFCLLPVAEFEFSLGVEERKTGRRWGTLTCGVEPSYAHLLVARFHKKQLTDNLADVGRSVVNKGNQHQKYVGSTPVTSGFC